MRIGNTIIMISQQIEQTTYRLALASTPRWYALYTRSQHEKLVESQLFDRGIEAYTPKITLRRKWSDRFKLIEEPLFKSYCFAKFVLLEDKIKILSQDGVVKIVNFHGQYVPVEESTITSLKVLIDSKLKIDPYPYLKEDTKIMIKRGSLKGLQGYILEKRNKNTTLVVSIDSIRASVKCIVDIGSVDLI